MIKQHDRPAPQGTFTGRHMLAAMIAFFGVIIAVNVTMARMAVGTFGGVVVENSYVASQQFNGWLAQAEAQQALGWQVTPARRADGHLELALAGVPAGAQVTAVARHPLGTQPDVALTFAAAGGGRRVSVEALPAGRWTLRLQVRAGGQVWRHEGPLP